MATEMKNGMVGRMEGLEGILEIGDLWNRWQLGDFLHYKHLLNKLPPPPRLLLYSHLSHFPTFNFNPSR